MNDDGGATGGADAIRLCGTASYCQLVQGQVGNSSCWPVQKDREASVSGYEFTLHGRETVSSH